MGCVGVGIMFLVVMLRRLFSTGVTMYGITLFSASIVSDSLPVCRMVKLPIPLKATSEKPLTLLVSLVTLPDPDPCFVPDPELCSVVQPTTTRLTGNSDSIRVIFCQPTSEKDERIGP